MTGASAAQAILEHARPCPARLAVAALSAGSALAAWFRERVGTLQGRTRRIAIVALARKLLIALWRYVEAGVVPAAARSGQERCPRRKKNRVAAGSITVCGDTGSATVFFFGGSVPPRFR